METLNWVVAEAGCSNEENSWDQYMIYPGLLIELNFLCRIEISKQMDGLLVERAVGNNDKGWRNGVLSPNLSTTGKPSKQAARLDFVLLLIKMSVTAGKLDPPRSLILACHLPNYPMRGSKTNSSSWFGYTGIVRVTGRVCWWLLPRVKNLISLLSMFCKI